MRQGRAVEAGVSAHCRTRLDAAAGGTPAAEAAPGVLVGGTGCPEAGFGHGVWCTGLDVQQDQSTKT